MAFKNKPKHDEPKHDVKPSSEEITKPSIVIPVDAPVAAAVAALEQPVAVEPEAQAAPEVKQELPVVEPEAPKRKAFRVTARASNGFWAIKRKFNHGEPVILFVDELSPEQIVNLKGKPPLALQVEEIEV